MVSQSMQAICCGFTGGSQLVIRVLLQSTSYSSNRNLAPVSLWLLSHQMAVLWGMYRRGCLDIYLAYADDFKDTSGAPLYIHSMGADIAFAVLYI